MTLLDHLRNWRAERRQERAAKALFQTGLSGWHTANGQFIGPWSFPNSKINYAQEVGDLRNSSIVMSGVNWVARGLTGAAPYVAKLDADAKETKVPDHPLIQLLRRPNDYYSGAVLLSGVALSQTIAATAYMLKIRSSGDLMSTSGALTELWYEPHWTIRPRWPRDGSEFISYYEIQRNGRWYPVAKDNVFCLRRGAPDMDTRTGTSSTASLIREFYTDQQASGLMAQLMRAGLIPPGVLSLGDSQTPFIGDTKQVAEDLQRKVSGDNAGKILAISGNAKFSKLGFNYGDFGFREVRQIPEERFCSAMGVSAISLHFASAADQSSYSNVEQYLRQDYRGYIVPLQNEIAEEMFWSLLPEFGETTGLMIGWDYSKVPEMQPDKKVEAEIANQGYQLGVLKRSEAREAQGYAYEPRDEVYYDPTGLANLQLPGKAIKRLPTEKELDEAADWWKQRAPEEAGPVIDAQKVNGEAKEEAS